MKAARTLLSPLSPALPLVEPLLPLLRRLLPAPPTGMSLAVLKATALECAILTGHLLLYPSGITQERREPQSSGPPPGTAAPEDDGTRRLPVPPRPPVLLLHGFVDNRSVFVLLRRVLSQRGTRQVDTLNHSPLTCDVRGAAELLARHVEELCERTGQCEVDIIGHSLGGLIARYYVQRLGGDAHVRTLVTLGTPHAGTRVAPLMDAHPVVRQMRPESDVIEELAAPAPRCRTRFVSFWSDLDQVMVPRQAACVDHPDLIAQNVRVTGVGHLALPVHPTVVSAVLRSLEGDLPQEAGAPADKRPASRLTVA